MATKLNKALIRDTGLKDDGKEVVVMLLPSSNGGVLAFKGKGKRGIGFEVPLSFIFNNQDLFSDGVDISLDDDTDEEDFDPKVKRKLIKGLSSFDTISMADLETRLMVLGSDVMSTDIKCKLWKVIREIREEERSLLGMPEIRDTKRGG